MVLFDGDHGSLSVKLRDCQFFSGTQFVPTALHWYPLWLFTWSFGYSSIASDGSPYEKRVDAKGRVLSDECIADEVPFGELPEGWAWARLAEVAFVLNGDRGKNYPAKSKLHDSGIPFVSAVNIEQGIVSKTNMLYMTEKQYSMLRAGKLKQGDVVFCIRGSLGKHGIFPFKHGAIASSLVIVRLVARAEMLPNYLDILFDSPTTNDNIRKFDNGTAQPNLSLIINFIRTPSTFIRTCADECGNPIP